VILKTPSSSSFRIFASVFSAGTVACCLFLWPDEDDRDHGLTESRTAIDFPSASEVAPALGMEAIEIAGETYELHLTCYAQVAQDGTETLRTLDPPATRTTLASRLRELHPAGGAYPILYPENSSRSAANRQLLTSAVTIQLPPGVSAQQVAEETGMRLVELPAYAPGFAIYEAADPIEALRISQAWSSAGTLPLIEVQLARQQQLRSTPALPNDTRISSQWNLAYQNQPQVDADANIGVAPVWNYNGEGVRGKGVIIGIVDDGVDLIHEDLAPNLNLDIDYDWNGKDLDPTPASRNAHGTCCAGLVGARGNNGLGISGVAPESTMVALRVVGGRSTDRTEAESMAHRNDLISIKSSSWGPGDSSSTLANAGPLTRAAWQNAVTTGRNGKGTIFVWSGGNGAERGDNSNFDGFSNSIYTIAVGAIDSQLRPSYYSEGGSNIVCVAPSGGDYNTPMITSTDRVGLLGYSADNYAINFGGTSAACPTVAGVVALMLEKNPHLGWRDVQEILLRSSVRIHGDDAEWMTNGAGLRFHHRFGSGLVNAESAVNLAAQWQNLPVASTPWTLRQTLSSVIPDNNPLGLERGFAVDSDLRVEHVTVSVNIRHSRRGQLSITLTSPSGMVSELAPMRADRRANFTNWTFSSVRHWGESARGNWTLTIRDGVAKTSGRLSSAQLTLHGTAAP